MLYLDVHGLSIHALQLRMSCIQTWPCLLGVQVFRAARARLERVGLALSGRAAHSAVAAAAVCMDGSSLIPHLGHVTPRRNALSMLRTAATNQITQ